LAHAELTQIVPVPQTAHVGPQALLLLVASMHLPPHFVNPFAQVKVQAPAPHVGTSLGGAEAHAAPVPLQQIPTAHSVPSLISPDATHVAWPVPH
jgi:hypothetical protein